jgi:hypothetical protein
VLSRPNQWKAPQSPNSRLPNHPILGRFPP